MSDLSDGELEAWSEASSHTIHFSIGNELDSHGIVFAQGISGTTKSKLTFSTGVMEGTEYLVVAGFPVKKRVVSISYSKDDLVAAQLALQLAESLVPCSIIE